MPRLATLFERCAGGALLAVVAITYVPVARAQQRELSGWFHTIWVDPRGAPAPAKPRYMLIDDAGRWTPLDVGDAALRAAGGIHGLDRARVRVTGTKVAPFRASEPSALRVWSFQSSPSALSPSAAVPASNPQLGSKPYVAILCKFSDSTGGLAPSVYEQWMGPSYPGLGDYWREVSNGQFDIDGSTAVGWYTLPQPYSYYYPDGSESAPRFDALFNDCVDAADADVDFPRFAGIILQFNGDGASAYGGSATMTRDGATKSYGVTWMPDWSTPAVYAHEMGHTLGWPHSSGPYGEVYDSRWDVMSWPYGWYDATVDPPTKVGEETIVYHKAVAGWVPASRILVPPMPSTQSVMLERSAHPSSGSGYWMVQVPLVDDPGQSYTAAARRFVSYDAHLPGEAVILHTVDPDRLEWAHVVDPDHNKNPNDAGAMWTPGETFADSVNGISLTVDSMTATGFGVTIVRGWRLQLQVTGPGAVASSATGTCSDSCVTVLGSRGQTVTLTAEPDTNGVFMSWGGACSGAGPCTVSMMGDRSVTAHFETRVVIASDAQRPGAVAGTPYVDRLVASGGPEPITWRLDGGALPAGLTLNTETGVISGTPSEVGNSTFTVAAISGPLQAVKTFALAVIAPRTIASNAVRPDAIMGTPYTDTLATAGGRGDVVWTLAKGSLPTGLVLDTLAGVIHGVPAQAGVFTYTVAVPFDTLTVEKQFRLTVAKPSLAAGDVMDQLMGARAPLDSNAVRFLDLLGNANGRLDVGDVRAWLQDTGALASARVASDSTHVHERVSVPERTARTTRARPPHPEGRP